MAAALVTKLAVPFLLEAVRKGLDQINHPAAIGVRDAIGQLQNALQTGSVSPEQMSAANAHIEKMAQVEAEAQAKILESVNASLRTEVGSDDVYVRRMRPTFGYMMAVTWGAQMLAIAYVIITDPKSAGDVVNAMDSLGTIWAVALSVLGIYVYQRSTEKKSGAKRDVLNGSTSSSPMRYND